MRKLEENIRGHRGELFGNDLNVYRALVSGQLEETLPDMREYATRHSRKIRRWCLSDREIKIVVSAYRTYNGIAAEAARHLPYSTFTFLRCWREAVFKIRGQGKYYL